MYTHQLAKFHLGSSHIPLSDRCRTTLFKNKVYLAHLSQLFRYHIIFTIAQLPFTALTPVDSLPIFPWCYRCIVHRKNPLGWSYSHRQSIWLQVYSWNNITHSDTDKKYTHRWCHQSISLITTSATVNFENILHTMAYVVIFQ